MPYLTLCNYLQQLVDYKQFTKGDDLSRNQQIGALKAFFADSDQIGASELLEEINKSTIGSLLNFLSSPTPTNTNEIRIELIYDMYNGIKNRVKNILENLTESNEQNELSEFEEHLRIDRQDRAKDIMLA